MQNQPQQNQNRLELKREPTLLKNPQDDKMKFRLIAREILSDVEHLMAQHLLLTRLEIEKSMRFVKASFALSIAAVVFGFAAILSLINALVLAVGSANDWTPATTELVRGLLLLIVLGVCAMGALGAIKKLKTLPQKLSKQWKEEWQWLRKTL